MASVLESQGAIDRTPFVELGGLMSRKPGSINPAMHKDQTFELYSIPSYESREPEIQPGSAIGSSKQVVQPNDVLVSKIVPHIRRAWVVGPKGGHQQIASGEWIPFRSDRVAPDYLRHLLISDWFHPRFMQTVSGVGGSLLRARPAEVAKIQVPLPSLPEQRRIAAILDKADALRQKRREAIARLDQLLQSIFLEMFGDPVTNPRGWRKADFAEVVYFQEGPGVRKWQFRSAGVKLINVINIVDGELDLSKSSRYLDEDEVNKKYEHFLLGDGDYVIASSGVTWGKIAEVRSEHLPLCLNTSMIRVRSRDARIDKRYLRVFIEGPSFRRQIDRLITGSAQPNFGPSHLKKLEILMPPIEIQREFSSSASSTFAQKQRSEAQLVKLDSLFASVQQRAFTGQL
jgi:type I restriction enzyme S subunit